MPGLLAISGWFLRHTWETSEGNTSSWLVPRKPGLTEGPIFCCVHLYFYMCMYILVKQTGYSLSHVKETSQNVHWLPSGLSTGGMRRTAGPFEEFIIRLLAACMMFAAIKQSPWQRLLSVRNATHFSFQLQGSLTYDSCLRVFLTWRWRDNLWYVGLLVINPVCIIHCSACQPWGCFSVEAYPELQGEEKWQSFLVGVTGGDQDKCL